MITKRNEITQTIDPQGRIHVLTVTIIEEDGSEIGRTNHRAIIEPGDDVSNKPAEVIAVSSAVWTPEKIAAKVRRKVESVRLAK